MVKSTFFLSLFLVASAVTATPITSIHFWADGNRQGRRIDCPFLNYDVCYRLSDNHVRLGLSSASFENGNTNVNKLAVTLYSGAGCNGRMDRWGFTRSSWDAPYYIEGFQLLNDNVRSFKVAARDLSTTSGAARSDEEPTVNADCK
ncbi:hypothetical protein BG003_011157 [Podila horticola]|nr:hypothetical protein BG003_011157 [Podila horticola]